MVDWSTKHKKRLIEVREGTRSDAIYTQQYLQWQPFENAKHIPTASKTEVEQLQYFTPEPYRGTEPKNKTASEGDKTLWQHLMDRPRQPTITTARSAALNGLDDSLLKEINDVLRQTADSGGMATDGTTTKEVTFYPPLTPMSVPREATQPKLSKYVCKILHTVITYVLLMHAVFEYPISSRLVC